eukprot:TRINITY_DN9605_c0_g1_i1.p1 TRINITY_DN9605_c0_g1~~TRINITY_DN9605_c0_g1_i1.p1  ORF type:complete len:324 (+),score=41.32 TRINITY_DN9605_c0_g1_i1:176-1147(+)
MNIPQLCSSISVSNPKIVRKAEEYYRLSSRRSPAGIGKAEICRSAACVGLACSRLNAPADKSKLTALSGGNAALYSLAMNTISNLLNIRPNITSKQLAIRFRYVRLEPATDRILQSYRTRFVEAKCSTRQHLESIDFSQPVFIIAAFWHATQLLNYRVDKTEVLEYANVSPARFQAVYKEMGEICGLKSVSAQLKKRKREQSKAETSKRIKTASPTTTANDEEDEGSSDLDGEELAEEWKDDPSIRKSSSRRQEEDYKEWAEKALQESELVKEQAKEKAKKKTRQAVLSFGKPRASAERQTDTSSSSSSSSSSASSSSTSSSV